MDQFWKLFKESVIVQAIMALAVIGTMLYLYIVGAEVPVELVEIAFLILGFYFGTKVRSEAGKIARGE